MKPNPTSNRQKCRRGIIKFFSITHGTFHLDQLQMYLIHYHGISGRAYRDTTGRYMRELREEGVIDYEIVGNKADSNYMVK